MAQKSYVGVNGISRNISKIYVGVDGVARKCIKGYVGDENGIARQFFGKPDNQLDVRVTTNIRNAGSDALNVTVTTSIRNYVP